MCVRFFYSNLPFLSDINDLYLTSVSLHLTLAVILKELDQQTNHTSDASAEGEMKNRGSELGSFIVELLREKAQQSCKLKFNVSSPLFIIFLFIRAIGTERGL